MGATCGLWPRILVIAASSMLECSGAAVVHLLFCSYIADAGTGSTAQYLLLTSLPPLLAVQLSPSQVQAPPA